MNSENNLDMEQFVYKKVLPNGAIITIPFLVIANGETLRFLDTDVKILPNTVKFGFEVDNWWKLSSSDSALIRINITLSEPAVLALGDSGDIFEYIENITTTLQEANNEVNFSFKFEKFGTQFLVRYMLHYLTDGMRSKAYVKCAQNNFDNIYSWHY